jgi:hypothetical protein
VPITVRHYYNGFVSLFGVSASAPFIPPLLHLFLPNSSAFADYLYPPLGDFEWIAVAATLGILVITTFVVFVFCESVSKIRRSVPAVLMVILALSVCWLLALYVPYVRRVPVKAVDLEVPVSIGYNRTEFARNTYPQSTDWEILQSVGPHEDQIQKLWTPRSISVVRISLWFFYTLSVSCFLSIISLAIYRHAAETASVP